MVTKGMMLTALRGLGIGEGDILLTHSSFKSLGGCENGADTVISAMREAVGDEGTLVFPTLCQKDFQNAYTNWHLDAPSDVGYLTNYFRKLPGAKRSDQATHSVAAIGKEADYLTKTHGKTGLRYGIYGETPFSADSPWEKMVERGAKVLFLGCSIRACTFRHLAEYTVMDEYLKRAEALPEYEALKSEVWHFSSYSTIGIWPHLENTYLEPILTAEGKTRTTACGEATLLLIEARDFMELALRLLRTKTLAALRGRRAADSLDWLRRIEAAEERERNK